MYTDYKIKYIKRSNNQTTISYFIYEGEYKLQEVGLEKEKKQVYIRNKIIGGSTDAFDGIKSDKWIRDYLNKKLSKDKTREAIDAQKLSASIR